MAEDRDDLETYAIIASELARGADRAELLASHGLDEESFEALEERANEEMSGGAEPDGPGIPDGVARFDAVLRAAAAGGSDIPSLEDFARAFLVVQEGGAVHERLKERGLSVEVLLRGSAHYTPRLAHEPELAARFRELTSRSGKKG
ncbi:MAG: hypothetical protein HOV80_21810 [Polyangiaceae bacterium]|nr:hypothetical protein [Polyangiaceae bacterium]